MQRNDQRFGFPKKIKKQQPGAPALEMSHNASVTAFAAFAAAQGR